MAEHQAQAQALNGVSANGVSDQPWYATYPKASSEPAGISRQEVLQLLKSNTAPGENFVLIDLRRSSRGRGNRAAAWFADYLVEQHNTNMKSLVLLEGIKGWAAEKGEFVQYMQEYDDSRWQ
ncbi:hypothetical protein LTR32_001165 [Rachicladosporium monterosium]|uniref:Rhodanese domain-containing protein n=1 Tax=Rachicladosporium monterosium TaxID=1507873 RepID=A0ABR0LE28_9PEZI|nr:hypothetical protein LTR32_001165 [Rachicladosporium monterosium]